jgi:SAM-dependent methyltransferase
VTQRPPDFTERDFSLSATAHDLKRVDQMLDELADRTSGTEVGSILDLGCGMGALTLRAGRRLGVSDLIGVDADAERLEICRERGLKTFTIDLNRESFPLDDASIGLVQSFGVMAYLVLYDNLVGETARVLKDGGHFLFSMPNLGSYVNRASLLFGYQPREVEVSSRPLVGMLPLYKRREGLPPPYLHAATLRCMREVLDGAGLDIVRARPLSPDWGNRPLQMIDAVLGRRASLARRFIVLARRRPR